MGQLNRITQQPEIMGGKACIRGMRVTVGMIVGQIGAGHSVDDVLADYPYLEREDVLQALQSVAPIAHIESEADYEHATALLNSLLDLVRDDAKHPLYSLLAVVGDLIEAYEIDHEPLGH